MLKIISIMALCLLFPLMSFSQINSLQLSKNVTQELLDTEEIILKFSECYLLKRTHPDSLLNYTAYFKGNGTISICNQKVEIKYWNEEENGQYNIAITSIENFEEDDRKITFMSGINKETKESCSILLVKSQEGKILDVIFDSDFNGVANPFAATRRAYFIAY